MTCSRNSRKLHPREYPSQELSHMSNLMESHAWNTLVENWWRTQTGTSQKHFHHRLRFRDCKGKWHLAKCVKTHERKRKMTCMVIISPCISESTVLNREPFFSPKFGSAARFSSPKQRGIVHLFPFLVGLETFSSCPLQFERFLLHYCSFPDGWGRGERVIFLTKMQWKFAPVSRSCHAGAVVNVDFKRCRGRKNVNRMRKENWKLQY